MKNPYHSVPRSTGPSAPRGAGRPCRSAPRAAGHVSQVFFTKNRLNRALPQHMPDTRVANEKNRVCHLMSPSPMAFLRIKTSAAAAKSHRRPKPRPCHPTAPAPRPRQLTALDPRSPGPVKFQLCHRHLIKNRRIFNLPQHATATRVAIAQIRLCHLMSPSAMAIWRPKGASFPRNRMTAGAGRQAAGHIGGRSGPHLARTIRLDFGLAGGLRYCEEPIILPFHGEPLA
jgi:hypothetical protein